MKNAELEPGGEYDGRKGKSQVESVNRQKYMKMVETYLKILNLTLIHITE